MTDLVYRGESNQPLTNSLLVAEVFGKEHRNVVRDIKNLFEGGVLKNEQAPNVLRINLFERAEQRATNVHYEPRLPFRF